MRNPLTSLLVVAVLGAGSGTAVALHTGDIYLEVQDDRIVTGIVEGDGSVTVPNYVFPAEFGDSGFPTFTQNPGFDCYAGTFTPSTQNGFNILSAVLAWDGAAFGPTAGETITLNFSNTNVTSADGFVPGFGFFVPSDGAWHRHYNYIINPADGQPDPTPGVYLLHLELWSDDPLVGTSDPFWIVFDYDADPGAFFDAVTWAEANLPGPASCPEDLADPAGVEQQDLIAVLNRWGDPECLPGGLAYPCPEDLSAPDGVEQQDLNAVLNRWGDPTCLP